MLPFFSGILISLSYKTKGSIELVLVVSRSTHIKCDFLPYSESK